MIDWIQAGALGVVVLLVLSFLGFLTKEHKVLDSIADRCHATQDRATEAIKANSVVLGRVEKVMDQLRIYLIKKNGD